MDFKEWFHRVLAFIKRNALLLLLVKLITSVYVIYYFTPSKGLEILQMNIEKLNIDHILEKKPIVIHDRIVNPMSLLDTVFKFNKVTHKEWIVVNKSYAPFAKNKSMHLVIYASRDCVIQLVHPKSWKDGKPEDIVLMGLKKHQAIIVPFMWWYSIKGTVFLIEIDTIPSLLYKLIL